MANLISLNDRLENCCNEAVAILSDGIAVDSLDPLAGILAYRHDITRQEAAGQVEIAKAITQNLNGN